MSEEEKRARDRRRRERAERERERGGERREEPKRRDGKKPRSHRDMDLIDKLDATSIYGMGSRSNLTPSPVNAC